MTLRARENAKMYDRLFRREKFGTDKCNLDVLAIHEIKQEENFHTELEK